MADLEREKIKHQNLLLEAKAAEIQASIDRDKMLEEALKAIKSYRGEDEFDEEDL